VFAANVDLVRVKAIDADRRDKVSPPCHQSLPRAAGIDLLIDPALAIR
jgi:hypothetical protein